MTAYQQHHVIQAGKDLLAIHKKVETFKEGKLYPFLEVRDDPFDLSSIPLTDFIDTLLDIRRKSITRIGGSSSTCRSLVDTFTSKQTGLSKSANFLKLLFLTVQQLFTESTRRHGRGG